MDAPQPQGIESPAIEMSSAVTRRAGILVAVALASVLVFGIGMALEGAAALPLALVAAAMWIAGPGNAFVRPLLKRAFLPTPGSVALWNRALVLRAGQRQEILRDDQITEARLRPLEGAVELVVEAPKAARIAAPDFGKALTLLDAAGVAPQKRTYVARLGDDPAKLVGPWITSAVAPLAIGAFLLLLGADPVALIWLLPVFATAALHMARRSMGPAEIALAANGLTLTRRGERRFFHYGGLRDVRLDPSRLRLFTDNGQEVGAGIEGLDAAAREAIEGWVQERRQSFASTAAGTDAFAVLDRHGRSLETWRASLKGVLQQEGQYRRAPISIEDLSRLLANPHTPAERRVAAAFVLSENQSVTTQKQIRFAAESSSSQPMRIALRALADDKLEEDAIEEALAAETGSLAR